MMTSGLAMQHLHVSYARSHDARLSRARILSERVAGQARPIYGVRTNRLGTDGTSGLPKTPACSCRGRKCREEEESRRRRAVIVDRPATTLHEASHTGGRDQRPVRPDDAHDDYDTHAPAGMAEQRETWREHCDASGARRWVRFKGRHRRWKRDEQTPRTDRQALLSQELFNATRELGFRVALKLAVRTFDQDPFLVNEEARGSGIHAIRPGDDAA